MLRCPGAWLQLVTDGLLASCLLAAREHQYFVEEE